MDILIEDLPEEGFGEVEEIKGSPVSKDVLAQNIRDSALINAPIFKGNGKANKEGSFIFVAGGPTLLDHMDELKKRADAGEFICTSNLTHDFLIDNDIIPNICIVIDPKERIKDYIKKPNKDIMYCIGTVCDKRVAQNLLDAGMNVQKLLVAYGSEDNMDLDIQRELYDTKVYTDYLVGGTMAGLRAMPFAIMNGYKKIEYYGFDSCFSGEPPQFVYEDDPDFEEVAKDAEQHYLDTVTGKKYAFRGMSSGFFYAYSKRRGENILIARTSDGRKFVTSPAFAHQAKQLIKWIERLEGHLVVEIHGDSLSSHYLECYRDSIKKAAENIGTKRWTNGYGKLQYSLHETDNYGIGNHDIELVSRQISALYTKVKRPITVLDYGCGDIPHLSKDIDDIFKIVKVTNYDPFVDKYSAEPKGRYDIVYCFDVMEHVEKFCVQNVLEHIKTLAKYMVCFSIAFNDAEKVLLDGRNAHITQKQPRWWAEEIQDNFAIGEARANLEKGVFVCMPYDAEKEMEKEL